MPKTKLTKEQVQEYGEMLLAKRRELVGDMEQLANAALRGSRPDTAGGLSSMPIHMADIGSENFEQEFTISLVESGQVTLEEIDAALARIREGTFGSCEECNGRIPKQRLKAIPYTPYCVECARKLEQKK